MRFWEFSNISDSGVTSEPVTVNKCRLLYWKLRCLGGVILESDQMVGNCCWICSLGPIAMFGSRKIQYRIGDIAWSLFHAVSSRFLWIELGMSESTNWNRARGGTFRGWLPWWDFWGHRVLETACMGFFVLTLDYFYENNIIASRRKSELGFLG